MTIEQDLLDCVADAKAVTNAFTTQLVNLQNAVAQAQAGKPFEQVDAVIPAFNTLQVDDVDALLFGGVDWTVLLHDPSGGLHRKSLVSMVQGSPELRYLETQIIGDPLPVVVCPVQVGSCFKVEIINNHVRDLNAHLLRYGVKY